MEADLELGAKVTTGADDAPDEQWKYVSIRPIFRAIGAGNSAGSDSVLIDIGGPNMGRWWEIRTVAVMANADNGPTVNTSIALYVTSVIPPSSGGTLNLLDCVRPSLTTADVPFFTDFGREAMPVQYPQHFVIRATGSGIAAAGLLQAVVLGWDRDVDELHDWSRVPDASFDRQ